MASIFMLILSFLCSQGLCSSSVAATSTIRVGDQLNSTTKLVSENGNFTLGFFTVGRPNSQNSSYFGVWYTNDNQWRKVWVANPNSPITNSFGVLTIDSTGTLKITSGGSSIMILHDQNGTVNATATLEDSGNFVLMDAADRRILWQSFDHPTNTLLAGMKLGYNLTSRQNWTLTSWLNGYVPAAGAFDLSLESIGDSAQLVIHRRGELYWTSGPWNNVNFEFVVALKHARYPYNSNYVSNGAGKYFTFDATDANINMLELTSKGEILDGANSSFVSPAGFSQVICCLADNGFVNTVLPRCRSQNDSFQEKSAYFLGTTSIYVDNTISSLSDCMERCWNNCSCVGFASSSDGTSCVMWSGNDKYQIDETGKSVKTHVLVSSMLVSSMPPPSVSSMPPPSVSSMPSPSVTSLLPVSSKSSKGNKWIWAVIAIAIFLGLLTLGSLLYLRMRKRRIEGEEEKRRKENLRALTASVTLNNADAFENNGRERHDLNIFSFASIAAATNNFSHQNKLGEGGFGPVYKGQLPEGREIAVKRLSRTSGQGLVEFKNELILITKLQHTNLVRVLGCCLHGEEKMLIYEYMPNKSLDFFLFGVQYVYPYLVSKNYS
ncbi:unnamed protein product [Ilex paraguariensis]|uniref:non-specific serine/threonine protein kinase n=1 Tax=Ilex paraguariensis TaxID=185542 RepID=A0ABC8S8J1_9AQUA